METQLKTIRVKAIRVIGQHRPVVSKKVQIIADSMTKIGLKTPITVRAGKKGPALITGLHRLEAARSLGWRKIDCFVMKGDKTERRLWTVAENLHRADLTSLQRSEFVAEWERLVKQEKGAQDAQPGGRQPKDKGISKTAKQLGITRDEVRRSMAVAKISRKAKHAAEAAGVADNQKILLEVAKEPKNAQVAKVHELANRKRDKKRAVSREEKKQFKALKRAFARAQDFKIAWNGASEPVRKKFVKIVLNPATIKCQEPDVDEDGWC
jgi:ParB family transcriptional regulator, chromosome partitioning protein